MRMSKVIRCILIFLIFLPFAYCQKLESNRSTAPDENALASQFGFDSVEEMERLRKLGFQSKRAYLDQLESEEAGFPSVKEWRTARKNGYRKFSDWESGRLQLELSSELRKFRDEWKEAEAAKNKFRSDNVLERFAVKLSSTIPLEVKRWKCEVISIESEKEFSCASSGIIFHLELEEPSPRVLGDLDAGEEVFFSGTLVRERSWTAVGAIQRPEINVGAASLARR